MTERFTMLLTRQEITAAHEGETCGDCGESIAREQLNKVEAYAKSQGWGRMIEQPDWAKKRIERYVFQPLTAEDFE